MFGKQTQCNWDNFDGTGEFRDAVLNGTHKDNNFNEDVQGCTDGLALECADMEEQNQGSEEEDINEEGMEEQSKEEKNAVEMTVTEEDHVKGIKAWPEKTAAGPQGDNLSS